MLGGVCSLHSNAMETVRITSNERYRTRRWGWFIVSFKERALKCRIMKYIEAAEATSVCKLFNFLLPRWNFSTVELTSLRAGKREERGRERERERWQKDGSGEKQAFQVVLERKTLASGLLSAEDWVATLGAPEVSCLSPGPPWRLC